MKKKLIAIAITLALATPAFAQNATNNPMPNDTSMTNTEYGRWDDSATNRRSSWLPWTSYGYVGIGVGQSYYDNNCAPGFGCDRRDTSWKIYTGGQISRIFGVEFGYVNLGEAHTSGGDVRAEGVNLEAIASLPIGPQFNLFAKGGGIYGWTRTSGILVPPGRNGSDNALNWTWGAGAQYDISRDWALRADWDRYRFNYENQGENEVSAWTANIVYKY